MTEAQGQGQAAGETQGTQDGTQVTEQDAAQGTPQTFTQKDLNKVAGQRAKEAEQRAINRILEQTGAESIDDVLSGFSEYQGIQEAVTTEADRANEKAERLEKRAKAAEERYTSTLRDYALRDALRDAGINPERLKGAMRLADASALQVDKDGNVSGIEDVVEAVREEAPEFFGTSERPRINAPQTIGTGVATPASSTDPEAAWQKQLMGILGVER